MVKSIGELHNELLDFMLKNHDILAFETFDEYIEYQYDYLSKEYIELVEYDKNQFVELVLAMINSNNVREFDYVESVENSLQKAKDSKIISDRFFAEAIEVLNDTSLDGDSFQEKVLSIEPTNEAEIKCIEYASSVGVHSKSFWQASGLQRRDWIVWGSDLWGGFVAGTLTGTLTANPVVGFLAGVAGSELMSACVGAVRNPR